MNKLLYIDSIGGTCDRCGKGIVNVAHFQTDEGKKTIGLDCAMKVLAGDNSGWEARKQVSTAIKQARKLSALKRAVKLGTLVIEIKLNDLGEECIGWYDKRSGKGDWLGRSKDACQSTNTFVRQAWEILQHEK